MSRRLVHSVDALLLTLDTSKERLTQSAQWKEKTNHRVWEADQSYVRWWWSQNAWKTVQACGKPQQFAFSLQGGSGVVRQIPGPGACLYHGEAVALKSDSSNWPWNASPGMETFICFLTLTGPFPPCFIQQMCLFNKYWVGQNVLLSFSIRWYRKTRPNFLTDSILFGGHQHQTMF